MSDDLITLRKTARILGVRESRAAELARQGILPVVRLGRQVRVDPHRLATFIQAGGQPLSGGWRRKASAV